jgi:Holliday junction resolvase RusA-like endonuclease
MSRGGIVYRTKKDRDYQRQFVALLYREIRGREYLFPIETALEVRIIANLPRPKTNKNKHHNTKPDLDNIIKQLDLMNGILWLDDKQIIKITAWKQYAAADAASGNWVISLRESE